MSTSYELNKRMKTYYESVPKTKLMRRTPVAIRIDGKAFHTFTRGFRRPFDEILIKSMQETMKYLCENIQGCVLGYTQSDEITLILVDYKNLDSSAWFDYEVQKMCSISASMATMAFNKFFSKNVENYIDSVAALQDFDISDERDYVSALQKSLKSGAMFDSRVFNIPKEEVTNLIYWRQLDAIINSIQMVGQANFSPKELNKKSCSMIKDMLVKQRGIRWDDLPTYKKRGSCCIKLYQVDKEEWPNLSEDKPIPEGRAKWFIDPAIPIFKGTDREYIESLINF